jgi:branched-chain amino acid transport system substrate-binding protein
MVAAAGLVLTGCSLGSHGGSKASSSASPSASYAPHQGDGILKIGTLLPETGSLVILGPQQIAAVKLAVQDINNAGGVLGKLVQSEDSDSGDASTDIASQSVNRLINDNVDAIVGAASSSVTLNVIDKVTGSGLLMISGSATSTKLQDYPDHGLFFRTAPSDVYQGRVVANTAIDDGAQTMGILALQDAYGTSLADQAGQVFSDSGGKVVLKQIYDPKASDYTAEVAALKAANPDAMVLIGFDESSKIIQEMVKQSLLPLKSHKHMYMVDGNMTNTYTLPAGTLAGVKGTIPGSKPTTDFESRLKTINPNLTDYNYAGEAYDATVLTALASEEAKSDNGIDIAAHMQDITNGSTQCSSFADCDRLIKAGTTIHYMGISGPIDFDSNGNPSVASMGVYEYGSDNKYQPLKFVTGPISATAASASPSSSASPTPSSSASPSGSPSPSPSASSSMSPMGLSGSVNGPTGGSVSGSVSGTSKP